VLLPDISAREGLSVGKEKIRSGVTMLIIILLQLIIVISMIRASRSQLENVLPVFAFFVVLMPLESRLVVPGVGDFNTMRVALLTLLILYLMRKEKTSSSAIPLKALMVMHVIWALCSTFYSLSVVTSVKQLISQVVEYYLLYFLFIKIITRRETLYKIVFSVSMSLALCSVFSLLEAYANWSILRVFPANLWITYNGGVDPLYIEWGRGLRVRSTFPHPILFGDALAMSIPMTLYLLSIWENKRQRLMLWLSLALMMWAIYKTSSRGPWIATGMCSVLLFVLINNRVRKYLIAVAVIGVIVMLSRPGIWQTVADMYTASTDATSPVGASYLYRDTLSATVKSAVAKDTARSLLGYGLGTFRELGLDITFLGVTQRWYTCDDQWAAFLYETGYVGLLIIGALLMSPLWIAFRSYRTLPKPENRLSGVFLISLAGFYFLLISVAGYSWGQQGYLSWIIISLIVCHSRLPDASEESDELSEEEEQGATEYDLNYA
jgi:hypothetical protein